MGGGYQKENKFYSAHVKFEVTNLKVGHLVAGKRFRWEKKFKNQKHINDSKSN